MVHEAKTRSACARRLGSCAAGAAYAKSGRGASSSTLRQSQDHNDNTKPEKAVTEASLAPQSEQLGPTGAAPRGERDLGRY